MRAASPKLRLAGKFGLVVAVLRGWLRSTVDYRAICRDFMIDTPTEARELLERLGASKRLLMHLQLVGEAADQLILGYSRLQIPCDTKLVSLGVAVHDAGKILHPAELDGAGSHHEPAGEALLLSHGVQAEVARCCVTHAAWQGVGVSFEERSVALADKLWKGKRVKELEEAVIDEAAVRAGRDRWDLFTALDSVFEEIANEGPDRLARSR